MIRVPWSAKGHKFIGGVLRTMTVNANLAGGKRQPMLYHLRPCLAKDGNPNDPNAAGNAVGV